MEKQMINLSELLDRAKKKALEKPDNQDGYAPKSTDELRFKRKHVSVTTPDANKNGDDVFKGTNVKAVDRQPHYGYNPGQDEEIYEEKGQYKKMAMAHANRASKALEAVDKAGNKDHESFHRHLANYHESMGKWHESNGRHSAADREYDRAAFHTHWKEFYANPEEWRKNFEKEKGD
jgi:hypothetical protein